MQMPSARTLPGLLEEMSRRFGDRNFITDHQRRLSYAEFLAEARVIAKGLHALGVRRGDKVAILMGNQAKWLLVDFAVTMLGGVLVALNTWWRHEELHSALASSDSSMLVMVDKYIKNDYVASLNELGDLTVALPGLKHVVVAGEDIPAGATRFAALYEMASTVPDKVIDDAIRLVKPEDTAYLLFTSGSTARAKPVELTHRGIVENPHGIGERMHLSEADRLLLPTSVFWALSCVNGLFAAMTHGASVVLQYRYEPGEMLRLIEAEQCTAAYTLPNIVLDIHAHPDRSRRDLRRWRTGTCRPNVMHLMAEMGVMEMITGYGLTEGYGHSVETDAHDSLEKRQRNVGFALPNNEVEVVDPVTRMKVAQGQPGEIRLRGHVTPGYYKNPQRTAEAFDGDGWFYTGDVGVFEEDGSLTIKGRIKDMIKTGGINVTPADVEEVLQTHPAVQQAIVVGVPHPRLEEIVSAMVVLKHGVDASPEELIAHCAKASAKFKVPRFIDIIGSEAVPLTDTGKVHKGKARDILTARYRALESAK